VSRIRANKELTVANPKPEIQIRSYRDLVVWQKAMDLAVDCYRATTSFPKHETYGLTAQLHRAAVSVAANIAEGRSRQHTKEFLYHLSVAYGSLAELETHIEIARRLTYLPAEEVVMLLHSCAAIGRMINGLRNSLHNKELQ
jgi:four helix bundle protein